MRRADAMRLTVGRDGTTRLESAGYLNSGTRSNVRSVLLLALFAGLLAAGLLFAGGAAGEDPPVTVGAGNASFARHTIDQGDCAQTLRVNGTGDIDGDGRVDLVTAGDSGVYWFDSPGWACHAIATGQYGEGSNIVTRDVNGDGRLDVITGDRLSRQLVWFENTGNSWTRHLLSSTGYCHNMSWADVNGDGRADIGCTDPDHGTISWLEAPADPTAEWKQHVIDRDRPAWGNVMADIDKDGRIDMVAGRAWYRQSSPDSWTRIAYTNRADTARSSDIWNGSHFSDYEYLSVLDLNGDGRLDIVASLFAATPEGEVWAFLSPANPATDTWRGVEIDPGPIFSVHSQATADFDGSGRVQVFVGEMEIGGYGFGPNPKPELIVYRLDGDPATAAGWTRLVLDTVGTHEAKAVDVNGDGRVDLAGGDENSDLADPPRSGALRWWENTTAPAPPPITSTTTEATTTAPIPTTTSPTTTSAPTTTTAPSSSAISFVGVRDGQTVTGTAPWEASVDDPPSVDRVVFGIDGSPAWVERLPPYQFDATGVWDSTRLPDGAHTLSLEVTRRDGSTTSAAIRVTVRNGGGAPTTTTTTTPTTTTIASPGATAPPTVSGTAVVGSTLSTSTGSWSVEPSSYTYQWQRCDRAGLACADIPGAAASSYLVDAASAGKTLRIEITATLGGATATAHSAATDTVIAPVEYRSGASFGIYGDRDSRPVTVAEADDRLLVFEFAGKSGADQVTSVTYGGRALERLAAQSEGSIRAELWYMVDPPVGTAELAWVKSGSRQNCTWGVGVFAGVDGRSPFGEITKAGGIQDTSTAAKSITVAAGTGRLALGLAAFNGDTRVSLGPAPGETQTSRWSQSQSTTHADSSTADSDSVTFSWTPRGKPSFDWALLATSIAPTSE